MDAQEIGRIADEVMTEFRAMAGDEAARREIEARYRNLEDLGMWDVLEISRRASGDPDAVESARRTVRDLERACSFTGQ